MATVYGDTFNFGLMDHRISEKVFENYDLKLDYGRTTPALIIFDSGKAYPSMPNNLSAPKLSDFISNYKEGSCQFCPQPIKPPQSELGLYLEYAKNTVSKNDYYYDAYNYMQDNFNDTWVHLNLVQPNFGPQVGRKIIGQRLIFWIIVPTVLNGLVVFYLTARCICSCLCGDSNSHSIKNTKKTSTQVAASAR